MTAVDTPTTGLRTGPSLIHRPGRWIDNWNAEDTAQWNDGGKAIASRNLKWSIFAEFLGFVIWQLWSIVVVQLPKAGFIRQAQKAGVKFTLGTNNVDSKLGREEYALQMIRECELKPSDMFLPKPEGKKNVQVRKH